MLLSKVSSLSLSNPLFLKSNALLKTQQESGVWQQYNRTSTRCIGKAIQLEHVVYARNDPNDLLLALLHKLSYTYIIKAQITVLSVNVNRLKVDDTPTGRSPRKD